MTPWLVGWPLVEIGAAKELNSGDLLQDLVELMRRGALQVARSDRLDLIGPFRRRIRKRFAGDNDGLPSRRRRNSVEHRGDIAWPR